MPDAKPIPNTTWTDFEGLLQPAVRETVEIVHDVSDQDLDDLFAVYVEPALDPGLSAEQRAAAIAKIKQEFWKRAGADGPTVLDLLKWARERIARIKGTKQAGKAPGK
jgi:hypothetical protein